MVLFIIQNSWFFATILLREHSINNGFVCKAVREISMALFNIGLQYKRVVVEFLHYDVAE